MPHFAGIDAGRRPTARRVLDADRGVGRRLATSTALGCAAYLAFEYRLIRGLFDDELGTLARDYVGGGASWQAMIALLDDPTSPWWDDTTTTGRTETAPTTSSPPRSTRPGAELRGAYGDPKDWTWGRLHQATFREADARARAGSGRSSGTSTRARSRSPGAAGAVDNNYYRPSGRTRTRTTRLQAGRDRRASSRSRTCRRTGSSIDMGDLDGARIVQTTGQSGNPFDSHYGDLIDDWVAGRDGPAARSRRATSPRATVETLTARAPP